MHRLATGQTRYFIAKRTELLNPRFAVDASDGLFNEG